MKINQEYCANHQIRKKKKKGGQNHCIENKRNTKHDNVADDIRTYCNRVSKEDNVEGLSEQVGLDKRNRPVPHKFHFFQEQQHSHFIVFPT